MLRKINRISYSEASYKSHERYGLLFLGMISFLFHLFLLDFQIKSVVLISPALVPVKESSVRVKLSTQQLKTVPVPRKVIQPKKEEISEKIIAENPADQVIAQFDPSPIKNILPHYPSAAKRRGHQGQVVVKMLINEQGNVEQALVLKSSGYEMLDESALQAVKKWIFPPLGRTALWVQKTIEFKLI